MRTLSKIAFYIWIPFSLCTSCSDQDKILKTITISNPLDMDRSFETVSLHENQLGLENGISIADIIIAEKDSWEILSTQTIDTDADGKEETILFQPKVKASSSHTLLVLKKNPQQAATDSIEYCYSRFVPERTDDYTWENNRVGFRTFGPVAQKMVEDSIKGGTLSSGIDGWLKKVEYPIINKWYEKHVSEKGSYHEDTGEGLDNFHVGKSRGIGGTALKIDSTYHTSDNFKTWKTRTTGPIRTSFVLTYSWKADSLPIEEIKHISLDYGQNLTRFEIELKGASSISTGLTLHENDGKTSQNIAEGWFSYWQPHGDSYLGTAVVVPGDHLIAVDKQVVEQKDLSNIYGKIKQNQHNKIVFYAGFGWKESGQFTSESEWNQYIQDMSKKLKNPLTVTVE